MDSHRPPEDLEEPNPYAPPQSTFAPSQVRGQGGAVPFEIGGIMDRSWTVFKQRTGAVLSVVLGTLFLSFVIGTGLDFLLGTLSATVRDPALSQAGSFVLRFAAWVVSFWLTIGQTLGLLKIARGDPVAVEDVFRGGPTLLTVILAWVLFALALAAPMFFGIMMGAGGVAFWLAHRDPTALLLVPLAIVVAAPLVLYVNARLGMCYYLAIDRDVGVTDSLRWAWELTRGRALTIIGLYILCLLINLAGALACGIGLLVSIPFSMLVFAVTYLALLGPQGGDAKPELETWEADD
jgi:hypothetical protein